MHLNAIWWLGVSIILFQEMWWREKRCACWLRYGFVDRDLNWFRVKNDGKQQSVWSSIIPYSSLMYICPMYICLIYIRLMYIYLNQSFISIICECSLKVSSWSLDTVSTNIQVAFIAFELQFVLHQPINLLFTNHQFLFNNEIIHRTHQSRAHKIHASIK